MTSAVAAFRARVARADAAYRRTRPRTRRTAVTTGRFPADDKQALMTRETTLYAPAERLTIDLNGHHDMQLLNEALARAQMEDRLREAEEQRRARRLVRARRLARKAEAASLRARRAMALSILR
ncbi:hypothetical protein [Allostreptomyces psammosilenae]|uniref:Uncharacterized protein n=1 Tax=Allostreptomyces psammosilenae TaxID=1892865 RepID=A0A852ZWD2_9ACTN|nr:hypothetical protein [Allostreptomyces psammosilenae]NYI06265.1 hypothetical protein [Allostreptomyces psammosilenae]